MSAELATVFNNLGAFAASLEPQLQAVLDHAAQAGVEFAQAELSTAYPPASAPNTPPAYRSGELYDSVEVVPDHGTLESIFHADGGHAIYLEFGTTRMAARPFMHPAAEVAAADADAGLRKLAP